MGVQRGVEKLGGVTVTPPMFSTPLLTPISVDIFFRATGAFQLLRMMSCHVKMTFASSTSARGFHCQHSNRKLICLIPARDGQGLQSIESL